MSQHMLDFDRAYFDGPDLTAADHSRLAGQMARVFELMKDGGWRTLREIAAATGDPEASVSAQLRHLRKRRFGSHVVERRHDGGGLYSYRLVMEANSDGR